MTNPLTPGRIDKAGAAEIAKAWWVVLVAGLVSVVVGIVILSIDWTAEDLALIVAILFIVRGVLHALSRPIDGSGRGWNIFVGIIEILVGVAFVSWPSPTLHVVAIFIGAWVIVSGLFHILGALANRHHDDAPWALTFVFGIIELAIGIVMLARPVQTLGLVIALVGLWAIVAGAFQIVLSFEIRRLPELVDDDPA
ncbi:MAG: DUF308 domain-containing protein [Acidimicrobiia bacterium]|nr:DUF308 domain-containing protein [Acidimicrobiia bacterium]